MGGINLIWCNEDFFKHSFGNSHFSWYVAKVKKVVHAILGSKVLFAFFSISDLPTIFFGH